MANPAIKKIFELERVLGGRRDGPALSALALRYYVAHVIGRQWELLNQAAGVLAAAGTADITLVFLRCFIAFEMGNLDLFRNLLAGLRPLRNGMKAHDPAVYAHYLFFVCLESIAKGRGRAANKHYRALADFCEEHKPPCSYLLLAGLNYYFEDDEDALEYLAKARSHGENSPLFFVCLVKVLDRSAAQKSQNPLLLPAIRWGLNAGYDLRNIISKNQGALQTVLGRSRDDAEAVYAAYPLDWVLYIVCIGRMTLGDLSARAFYYYKQADVRQLHFPQLYDFLLRSAYKNGIEDVSRYSLAQYVKHCEISGDIAPFVYHLVLKSENEGFLQELKYDILDFARQSLENRLFGRYYYTVYNYLLLMHAQKEPIDKKLVEIAEEAVKNVLFAHDIIIDNPNVKKIHIREEYRRGESLLEVRGGRVRVNLCSAVKITCFDESLRRIIPHTPHVVRLLDKIDIDMLKSFYDRGLASDELYITLAAHYMNQAKMPHMAIAVLESAAQSKQAARGFVMQIDAALGHHYAARRDFDRAVAYYADIDEDLIDPKYTEQMLLAYVSAGSSHAAARLISRNIDHIGDKNLFYALRRLVQGDLSLDEKKSLGSAAYRQLIRGWYDRSLVELVMSSHAAPLAGWIDLYKSLTAMGVLEAALSVKILDLAIKIRATGANVQNVFVKAVQNEGANPDVLRDYALYLSYEAMVNNFLPENATVFAMEETFSKTGEIFIAYGLAHIYLSHDLSTAGSRDILRQAVSIARENRIIWPVFKEIKDKTIITPYIEKSTPFVYQSRAGIEAGLHFRLKANEDFAHVPMRYQGFGLYVAHIPHFYGEELDYYFTEAISTGSISTNSATVENNRPHILEKSDDLFYTINNALIYEQMFKYDQVEEIVTQRLAKGPTIRANLM